MISSSENSLSSSFNEDASANPDADYLTNPLLEKLSRPFRYPRHSSNESLSNGDHSGSKQNCVLSYHIIYIFFRVKIPSFISDWLSQSRIKENIYIILCDFTNKSRYCFFLNNLTWCSCFWFNTVKEATIRNRKSTCKNSEEVVSD